MPEPFDATAATRPVANRRTGAPISAGSLALRIGIAALIVLAAIAMLQNRLLYFPAKTELSDFVSSRLKAWPSEHEVLGLVAEPDGPIRATAVVFHGNAGHAGHRDFYAAALLPLGLRVILAEYPGYGPRSGAIGEAQLVDDAERALALAHRLHGAPLIVVGESLGAGVAAAAAARERDKVAALMLITPWDRLEHVASFHYPWLPVRWLLRDRYDSSLHLASFAHPVLVVVAERDSIVPARFGTALYEALSAPKRLAVIDAAEHNDWTLRVDATWWRNAMSFLLDERDAP